MTRKPERSSEQSLPYQRYAKTCTGRPVRDQDVKKCQFELSVLRFYVHFFMMALVPYCQQWDACR